MAIHSDHGHDGFLIETDAVGKVVAEPAEPGTGSMTAQVLWLYGADAVGKSAVGWEAYTLLAEVGEAVAYVDTDYLGFCSTAPADRTELVARNLGAVWAGFAATGVRLLVVSGIVVTPTTGTGSSGRTPRPSSPSAG